MNTNTTRRGGAMLMLIASMSGAMLGVCGALPGCNIVGPAAYLIEGPPKRPAVHELADVPTVVFIDDRLNRVNPTSMRRVIADRASQDLMVKKVLEATISPQDAMTVARQRETAGNLLPIEEIGRLVGAQQVIYVQMEQFDDLPDRMTPRPSATCRVRVIDVAQRTRVFPPADAAEPSYLLQVSTREVNPEAYTSRSGRLELLEQLAQETGKQIARMFYEHEARELGGNLNPR